MSDSAGDNTKPRVVVLGGCGFIGRNLVEYLITNDLVSSLRVVDKTPPQLAFLNSAHTKAFEDPRVEYKSANLINPSVRNVLCNDTVECELLEGAGLAELANLLNQYAQPSLSLSAEKWCPPSSIK